MNTEIVCALIVLTGTVISALISTRIAKSSAEKEIQKMRLEWKRQDIVSTDEDFAEMAVSVSNFIQTQNGSAHRKAVETITKIRAKEAGAIAESLDALYEAIGRRGIGYSPNFDKIENLLTKILKQKRNSNRPY